MKQASSLQNSTSKLILYVIFPLTQLILLLLTYWEVTAATTHSFPLPLFMLLLSGIFIIFLLYLFWDQQKQKRLKISYHELSYLRAVEEEHYLQIKERREELEQLKAAFSKELVNILSYLSIEDITSAKYQMDALSSQLAATKEYPYCNNPVINAILTEKKKVCDEKIISLSVNISICRFDNVQNLHLCSIFSNLIDNAIHACERIKDTSERSIKISVGEFGDYLVIKVINSSLPLSSDKPVSEHGFGQKIVQDIAKQYNGHFTTSYNHQQYTAIVSLLLQKSL